MKSVVQSSLGLLLPLLPLLACSSLATVGGFGCAGGDDSGDVPGSDASLDATDANDAGSLPDSSRIDADVGPVDARDAATDGAIDTAPFDVKAAVEELDGNLASAICERLTGCCSKADYDSYFTQFTGKPYTYPPGAGPAAADCAKVLKEQLGLLHAKWIPSIGRGRMTFDAAKGTACVSAISSATCGSSLEGALYDGSCFDVRDTKIFTKIAPVGSSCADIGDTTFNGECDPGVGYCDGPPSAVKDRKCVAWKKPGEDCGITPSWQFCDTRKGSNCDGGTATKPGKCSALAKKVALGDTCAADSGPILECPAGSFCDEGPDTDGYTNKCVALRDDGAKCHWDYECKTAHARTCFPTDPIGAGGKCGSAAWCGSAVAGDAGVDASADVAADVSDTTDTTDTSVADTAPKPAFTVQLADAPSVPSTTLVAALRDRVLLQWKATGATSASITGAGSTIAVIHDGTPTWDDLAAGTGLVETTPTSSVLSPSLPFGFTATVLGDDWKSKVYLSKYGVMSRYAGSTILSNPSMPIPAIGISPDWTDGTLAPFLDTKLTVNTGTSKIRTATFGAGTADGRFVAEWLDFTTASEAGGTVTGGHVTLQGALYKDGRVEYRYQTHTTSGGGTTPNADLALVRGQGATIGLANSAATEVLPLSVRRASLPTGGITYTFTKSDALPAEGRAIFVLPKTASVVNLVVKASTIADASATITVEEMYAQSKDTAPVRDISTLAGVTPVIFSGGGSAAILDLPFAIDAFREGWRSLAIARVGAITTVGSVGLYKTNDAAFPSANAPSGVIAPAWLTTGNWCSAGTTPQYWALVEGAAPSRTVTVLMKSVHKCGAAADALDVETVLHENGDVDYVYGNLTSTADGITGGSIAVGLENGNGDVGYQALRNEAGKVGEGTRLRFVRHK